MQITGFKCLTLKLHSTISRMQNLRKFFSAKLAVLLIVSIGGIGAHPTETDTGDARIPSNATASTETACPGVPKSFYEELDCKPVFQNPEDRCPVRYTCESFEQADLEMCYFRGEAISPGTELNDTGNPCDIGCYCDLDEPSAGYNITKMAVFNCAIVDCPLEEESAYDENGELRSCVPKKSHEECCASETVCLDDAEDNVGLNNATETIGEGKSTDEKNHNVTTPAKLAKCVTADNKTYVEGQEFYPEEFPCKTCICQPGYTAGEFGEPWCRDVRCGTFLGHTRQIREGCAPVYYGNSRCCPIDFICPEKNDTVISDVLIKIAPNPDETCKFGDLFLRVGDRLAPRTSQKCVECVCEVPPFLTCHAKAHCEP